MLGAAIAPMNSGILRLYSGTRPAGPDTALSGNTVLSEHTLSATSAPAASGGVLTLNAIAADASANASGTATFARQFQSDGTTALFDWSVSASGGGGEIIISPGTTITAGQTVTVTGSPTITFPLGT
jgi:hypothetical protein